MPVLHIFNPSHDEALAADTPLYTPTKAARMLAADLCLLPAWWADQGDILLVPEGVCHGCSVYRGVALQPVGKLPLPPSFWDNVSSIAPWGWDACLAGQLRRAGAPERLLPSAQQLAVIRALSSRRTAVSLLRQVRKDVPGTVGESAWCASMNDVVAAVGHYGEAIAKAPWSSSGRGVFRYRCDEATHSRLKRLITRQGGVEIEPFYDRIQDFALEFTATPGGIVYEGLSVFATGEGGNYTGNTVASGRLLREMLPPELHSPLDRVRESLVSRLETLLAGRYCGPLGVDMMVVRRPEGTLALHPLVELNLRRTMGFVALELRKLLPGPDSCGVYAVCPAAGKPAVGEAHPAGTGNEDYDEILLTPGAVLMKAVLSVPKSAR